MPIIPPKELYQHPDPLLRRLRLVDSWGKQVDLQTKLRDTKVVLFLFGYVFESAARWADEVQWEGTKGADPLPRVERPGRAAWRTPTT